MPLDAKTVQCNGTLSATLHYPPHKALCPQPCVCPAQVAVLFALRAVELDIAWFIGEGVLGAQVGAQGARATCDLSCCKVTRTECGAHCLVKPPAASL